MSQACADVHGAHPWCFFAHSTLLTQTGEDGDSIQPTVQRLHAHGIGSILDYAAEDDVASPKPTLSRTQPHDTVVARTYAYEDEAACDRHAEVFTAAIDAAARSPGVGFAAVKVTALGLPLLLERVSSQLVAVRDLFREFDLDKDGLISRGEFTYVVVCLRGRGDCFCMAIETDCALQTCPAAAAGAVKMLHMPTWYTYAILCTHTARCMSSCLPMAAVRGALTKCLTI